MNTTRTKARGGFLRKTLIVVLVFLGLSVLLLLGAGVFFYQSTDFSMDEELFRLAKGSKTTRIYYNENGCCADLPLSDGLGRLDPSVAQGLLPNGYVAKEMEDQRVHGVDNGIWCAYADVPQHAG